MDYASVNAFCNSVTAIVAVCYAVARLVSWLRPTCSVSIVGSEFNRFSVYVTNDSRSDVVVKRLTVRCDDGSVRSVAEGETVAAGSTARFEERGHDAVLLSSQFAYLGVLPLVPEVRRHVGRHKPEDRQHRK